MLMTHAKKGVAGLMLGAIGVVFGDIGTSPLYAVKAVFSPLGQNLSINAVNIHGILSLIFWAITLVVSFKYVCFIMRADNEGEGGIMALVARIKSGRLERHQKWIYITLGLIGVSLFYGDSAITPAISILSAMEGVQVVAPQFSQFILPTTLTIVTLLFFIQKFGTNIIGKMFGPVMLVWFLAIGAGGLWQVYLHPSILASLSPVAAWTFFETQPLIAFAALGTVVLAITGAEALYADMGHFGRGPIARAWIFLVFPALILCYLGQGALLLGNPETISSPFILLFPKDAQLFMFGLSTFATLIASQSVISGAFSLTKQAVQLNFMPKMLIQHKSSSAEGQIYIPFVNFMLFVLVVLQIGFFRTSENLAHAYGIAVSGTLALDTILFLVVARILWKKSLVYVATFALIFFTVDLLFVAANISKILHGGWFPIVLALGIYVFISAWIDGRRIISAERKNKEGSLQSFVDDIHAHKFPIVRVPGHAVYIAHHNGLAPLALHASVEELHELHEKVVLVSVNVTTSPHVPEERRVDFDSLKHKDGISELTLTYGFQDHINIPKALKAVRTLSPELDFDPDDVSYFVSLSKVVLTKRHNMLGWRKSLYSLMSRNALSASDYYKLPTDRTVEIRSLLEL